MNAFEQNAEAIRMTIQGLEENITIHNSCDMGG